MDPGEKVSETAIREFKEEALNSLSLAGLSYLHYLQEPISI